MNMEFNFESGRIFHEDEQGKLLAELTYTEDDANVYAVDHTFVDPSLRGQGVAGKLVEAVVDLAKKEGKKIKPVCPYVVAVFAKNKEYQKIEA